MNLYLITRIGMLCVVCVGLAFSLAQAGEIPQVGQKAPGVTSTVAGRE